MMIFCRTPSPCILVFFFSCSGDHRDLHSFPTRRSSDLGPVQIGLRQFVLPLDFLHRGARRGQLQPRVVFHFLHLHTLRSEEHTSELQSLTNLVCRLLLEKKKKNKLTLKNAISNMSQMSQ